MKEYNNKIFPSQSVAVANNVFVQRKCSECNKEDEDKVQRKPMNSVTQITTPDSVSSQIDRSKGSGESLPNETRRFMENRFNTDFTGINIHTSEDAVQLNRQLSSKAFTVGNDIYFNEGEYRPNSSEGKYLLAHELTHTIQQDGGVHRKIQRKSIVDNIHDRLLDAYSDYSGIPRDQVSQFDEGYEKWLQMSGALSRELQALIDGAVWKEIRKRVYPKESAAGIKRAKDRHTGALPDLTGLGRLTTLDRFATAVKGIQSNWTALGTPDNRVKELGKAANVELTAASVPEFLVVDKEPMEFKGFFSSREWKFVISQELVSAPSLPTADAAEVANTTLHEGRHAEQTFLAARFSAGVNGKNAAGLEAEQHIPHAIAVKAVAQKFDAGTDAKTRSLGSAMFTAMITDGPVNQRISDDDGLSELATKRDEAKVALANLNAAATGAAIAAAIAKRDALKAQITEVERRYTLYRNIPYEADAHEVGDAAEQAFKGWP